MKKVVHCIHGLSMGGAETIVKNYALAIDKSQIDLTVLCFNRYGLPYEKMLEENGIKVIYVSDYFYAVSFSRMVGRVYRLLARYYYVRCFIRRLAPDIIHIHLPISRYIRFAHPKAGTKIFYTQHFDVSRLMESFRMEVNHIKWLKQHYCFRFIALSEKMKGELDSLFFVQDTIVLRNGIDMETYNKRIDKNKEKEIIGLDKNVFVIGHIGRFSSVKNHEFLLNIFAYYRKLNSNAFLLLIGSGEEKGNILQKARLLDIDKYILILENRNDVNELLCAIDIFVFPSLMEGLGIAVIEAQVAGVICLVSDTIPKETKISNLIHYMPLSKPASEWAEKILDLSSRNVHIEYYGKSEWDIKCVVNQLEKIYSE